MALFAISKGFVRGNSQGDKLLLTNNYPRQRFVSGRFLRPLCRKLLDDFDLAQLQGQAIITLFGFFDFLQIKQNSKKL